MGTGIFHLFDWLVLNWIYCCPVVWSPFHLSVSPTTLNISRWEPHVSHLVSREEGWWALKMYLLDE